jgi:hypothetical protein
MPRCSVRVIREVSTKSGKVEEPVIDGWIYMRFGEIELDNIIEFRLGFYREDQLTLPAYKIEEVYDYVEDLIERRKIGKRKVEESYLWKILKRIYED